LLNDLLLLFNSKPCFFFFKALLSLSSFMFSLFIFIFFNKIKFFLFSLANGFRFKPKAEYFHHSIPCISVNFLELIPFLSQIPKKHIRLNRAKRQFNLTNVIMVVVLIITTVFLQRAQNHRPKVMRLEFLS